MSQMSLKWKIITNLEKRFNRRHTWRAEQYYQFIIVPKLLKGSMKGIHVKSVYPVTLVTSSSEYQQVEGKSTKKVMLD